MYKSFQSQADGKRKVCISTTEDRKKKWFSPSGMLAVIIMHKKKCASEASKKSYYDMCCVLFLRVILSVRGARGRWETLGHAVLTVWASCGSRGLPSYSLEPHTALVSGSSWKGLHVFLGGEEILQPHSFSRLQGSDGVPRSSIQGVSTKLFAVPFLKTMLLHLLQRIL